MTPTRQEFLFLSGTEKALFYVLAALSVAVMFAQIWQRAKLWRAGRPIGWKPTPIASIWTYVLGQRKVRQQRRSSGAPMHLLIFYGFLALFIGTTLLGINTYSPWKFHQGLYYLVYEATLDVLGLGFLVGVAWAFLRRVRFKPASITCEPADLWALALLFVVGATGYVLEAARMAANPQPFDVSAPIGWALSLPLSLVSPDVYRGVWWFHMVWVFVFFAVLPRMRIRHIVMAIFSLGGQPQRPWGRLEPISLEEVEKTGKIGVSEPADYSRWHLMALDACMECGRCTDVCPANGVGKVLNPKRVVQDLRGAMASGTGVVEAVGAEALWDCTTCFACVEACPVGIRHVDLIVDARRSLVAEGQLAGSAATMLRQVGSTSNAWGQGAETREEWMKGLDVPLARDGEPFDVLFWVGCAGATDPGAVKTTRAVAKLLKKAGIRFACLGREEKCTGDPARRVGEEFLAQEMIQQNVAMLDRYGVKKIVTTCPHCMNTLRNEYGPFGGAYEVLHHTQVLAEAIAEGKLKAATPDEGGVTYHDPCYLARVNGHADAPRALVGQKTHLDQPGLLEDAVQRDVRRGHLLEPARFGRKTLCCGAGGGRMWMEEPVERRPGDRRARELAATGAKTVAVACPFCRIMLDASLKQVGSETLRLVDLAELVEQANA
ncbi:MAG: heterodisulfide reductase-related iron-sulfur binding cluster [Fimbriimonadaceae bacterium]|nr:heterodisulfide reductase-related iron-sulfur binding cluster [Fimbriimonadaceae bacterium]